MRTMFQVGDFFVRLTDKGGHLKLAIWNREGEKIVSEFLTMANAGDVLAKIEPLTAPEVVQAIEQKLSDS